MGTLGNFQKALNYIPPGGGNPTRVQNPPGKLKKKGPQDPLKPFAKKGSREKMEKKGTRVQNWRPSKPKTAFAGEFLGAQNKDQEKERIKRSKKGREEKSERRPT